MKVESILKQYFEERGLILSKEKTFIKHISEGFEFVGFNFRLYIVDYFSFHDTKILKQRIRTLKFN